MLDGSRLARPRRHRRARAASARAAAPPRRGRWTPSGRVHSDVVDRRVTLRASARRVGCGCTDREQPRAGAGRLLWVHGGGHVLGAADAGRPAARRGGGATGCVAVAVDWRRAPEHPLPGRPRRLLRALRWLRRAPTTTVPTPPRRGRRRELGGGLAAGLALHGPRPGRVRPVGTAAASTRCSTTARSRASSAPVDRSAGSGTADVNRPGLGGVPAAVRGRARRRAGYAAPARADRPRRPALDPGSATAELDLLRRRERRLRRPADPARASRPSCTSIRAACTASTCSPRRRRSPAGSWPTAGRPCCRLLGPATARRLTTRYQSGAVALQRASRWPYGDRHMRIMRMIIHKYRGVGMIGIKGRPQRRMAKLSVAVAALLSVTAACGGGDGGGAGPEASDEPAGHRQGRLGQRRDRPRPRSRVCRRTRATSSPSRRSTTPTSSDGTKIELTYADTKGEPQTAAQELTRPPSPTTSPRSSARSPARTRWPCRRWPRSRGCPIIYTQAGTDGVVVGDYTYRATPLMRTYYPT